MDNKLTLKGQKRKWYPASISSLETHLESFIAPVNDFPKEKTYPLVKNLAYTLQYIEFLNQVISDINLSDVLEKQNIKSFVIHGASVIESIFQYLVVSSGNGTMTDWQSIKKLSSNTYLINQNSFKNETEIFLKIDTPVPKEMSFDQLAKKVESKKLLGNAKQLYADISLIRKLRNRVHLQGNKGTLLKTITLQGHSFMLRNLHASASQIRYPGNPSPCNDPWNRRPEYLSG